MAGCEHLVPLYGPPMSMNDAERKRELDSWNWDDLKCPEGHRIPRPSEPPL